MASCQNVQTYCAAQVFYWSGLNGIDYIFSVFIADTSLLENRMIWNAFQATPYIVNTFAGPELGQRFLDDSTFRWGYGAFTIITLAVSIPFWAVFFLMERRAKQTGVLQKRERSGRTFLQNVWHWAIEFDGESPAQCLVTCLMLTRSQLLASSLSAVASQSSFSPLVFLPTRLKVGDHRS